MTLEHLDHRHLPPVEPLTEDPERFSMTLLKHSSTCQRAGYLYLRHHGGMPAHALDRGTALHIAQAKVTNLILERHAVDAESLSNLENVIVESDGPSLDYSVDEDTAKLFLEETLNEHHELTIPLDERDDLRVMMSHLANGFPVNPVHIVGVEQKFVLPLGPHTVSGILDLALQDEQRATIRDYKSEWALPSEIEYEATFQGRLYAVLFVYGHPVRELRCEACGGGGLWVRDAPPESVVAGAIAVCPTCKGNGTIERLEPPLGASADTVDVGEVFPRFLRCSSCGSPQRGADGLCADCGSAMRVPVRHKTLDRLQIEELRRDIHQMCDQLADALQSWQFPATPGSHCSRCPCEPECPLPRNLRRYAGAINTVEQAQESAEWHLLWDERLKATRNEIKSFARQHGPIRFGTDQVWEFVPVTRRDTDWEGLEAAIIRAQHFGEPFDPTLYRRERAGTDFKRRKLSEAEL